jgi:phage regulator Rha-like protein
MKAELVANCDRFAKLKHSSSMPYAFTEHGAMMTANILNSEKAVDMSVFIVRAFVRMREMIETNAKFAAKLAELEDRMDMHDQNTIVVMSTLRKLLHESKGKPASPSKKIGFDTIPQQA